MIMHEESVPKHMSEFSHDPNKILTAFKKKKGQFFIFIFIFIFFFQN